MYTIKNEVRTIYEINKSRFITSIKPVKSIEEAKSFFLDIKKEFAEATHNVTAYIIGKQENLAIIMMMENQMERLDYLFLMFLKKMK